MIGWHVTGASVLIGNLVRVRQAAVKHVDESLGIAASFGADFTRAIAPIDTGAYRYGGVSRSGTVVPLGISWTKLGADEYAYGTPAPYGRRLELGFTGFDSMFRFYDQPAQPHFGPSMQPTGDVLISELMDRGFRR